MNKLKAKLFGSNPKKDREDHNTTIQKLRNMEELLGRKQEYFEKKIQDELVLAKKHGMMNKRAAMQALLRKKRFQKQLQQIDGTLTTLEMQREALESSQANTSILQAMRDASKALKVAHEHLKVDDVQDIMDDIAEQQVVAKEIADAISSPIPFSNDIDEDDLEKELEALTQEELDRELLSVHSPAAAHSDLEDSGTNESSGSVAGTARVRSKATDEDTELKELAQWGMS